MNLQVRRHPNYIDRIWINYDKIKVICLILSHAFFAYRAYGIIGQGRKKKIKS